MPSPQKKRPLNIKKAKQEFKTYGDWLIFVLAEKEISVPELAAGSGLSTTAIYKIRDKITLNPQSLTKNKIEEYLNSSPNKKTEENIREDVDIEGIGELEYFDPHEKNKNNMPQICGVYVLYDSYKRPVYIGSATKQSISERILQHREKFWFREPIVSSAKCLHISDEDLARKIEKSIIGFLGSHNFLNKKGAN